MLKLQVYLAVRHILNKLQAQLPATKADADGKQSRIHKQGKVASKVKSQIHKQGKVASKVQSQIHKQGKPL